MHRCEAPARSGRSFVALLDAIHQSRVTRWLPAGSHLSVVRSMAGFRATASTGRPDLLLMEIPVSSDRVSKADTTMSIVFTDPTPILLLTPFRAPTIHAAIELTSIRACRVVFFEHEDVAAVV